MTYLLDTNVAIALIKDRPSVVRRRFRDVADRGELIATSSIVLFELSYGGRRSAHRPENAERLRIFRSGPIEVLPFDESDALVAGEIRSTLERAGVPIGPFDLLIAGQALRAGAILVTANAREFSRVPDLIWEDWTA